MELILQSKYKQWLNGFKKEDLTIWTICCLQEIHFSHKDTDRWRVKGWKKIFQENGNQKKEKKKRNWAGYIYIKKIDFKLKILKRDKEDNYIIQKKSKKRIKQVTH